MEEIDAKALGPQGLEVVASGQPCGGYGGLSCGRRGTKEQAAVTREVGLHKNKIFFKSLSVLNDIKCMKCVYFCRRREKVEEPQEVESSPRHISIQRRGAQARGCMSLCSVRRHVGSS